LTYDKVIQLWNSFEIKTVTDLDTRLDSFRVLFAYNSGKIENPEVTYHDTREMFENNRVSRFKGDPVTLTEISNQKRCYSFLLPKIIAKEPLSVELLKAIHEITTMATYDDRRYFELGERPGTFKKNDFVVGRNEVGSMPEDVDRDISSLLTEVNEATFLASPKQVLKAATYLHAGFEHIHPFADGNGRVGRTIVNYFLMIHGHPPLIVYDEDRDDYYEGLRKYDEDDDLEHLYGFFMSQLLKTWAKTLERREKSAR